MPIIRCIVVFISIILVSLAFDIRLCISFKLVSLGVRQRGISAFISFKQVSLAFRQHGISVFTSFKWASSAWRQRCISGFSWFHWRVVSEMASSWYHQRFCQYGISVFFGFKLVSSAFSSAWYQCAHQHQLGFMNGSSRVIFVPVASTRFHWRCVSAFSAGASILAWFHNRGPAACYHCGHQYQLGFIIVVQQRVIIVLISLVSSAWVQQRVIIVLISLVSSSWSSSV